MAKATQPTRYVSRKDAATELGFSRQRLETLIKQGRVHETAEGIDINRAKKELEASLDPVRRQVYEETFNKPKPKAKAEPRRNRRNVRRGASLVPSSGAVTAGDDKQGKFELVSLNDAKAAKEVALARTAEIRLDQMRATLVSREEVKAKEFTVARMIRDRILAFPTRFANILPPAALRRLDEECKQLVRELQEQAIKIGEQSPQV